MTHKVLLLGLDGATYSVLDPMFHAGHMPALRRLLSGGASGLLESTVPPYTPPGWTSIFTGVNPGKHGIFGFHLGNDQRPGGLVRLDRVQVPAIWNAANAQGKRFGLFNVPMTYPAPHIDGFSVSGMLTPEGGGQAPVGFAYPPPLSEEIIGSSGSYEIDIPVDYSVDWQGTEILDRLSKNLAKKRSVLRYLLDSSDVSMLFTVLEAPDRLMHVHYKYLDPRCEHFHTAAATPIRERAWKLFDEMDELIGDLVDWVGTDGYAVTMSDHGFGPLEKRLNVNHALREWGLLAAGSIGTLTRAKGLKKVARRAKRILPGSISGRATRAYISWPRTKAFFGPAPQQGIYVNLKGREPFGVVEESRFVPVRAEVVDRFANLLDPDDGAPVADTIRLREEVFHGDQAAAAADIFPVCRSYSYLLADGLHSPMIIEDLRALPHGCHHMDGIFGIAGPGVPQVAGLRAKVVDIAPTALHLAGLRIPDVDGAIIQEALPERMLDERPPVLDGLGLAPAGEGTGVAPFTPEEEARLEDSLRSLGYL